MQIAPEKSKSTLAAKLPESQEASSTKAGEGCDRGPRKVAYMMSRFPKLTETFILYEILSVIEQGSQVEIFPLLRARNSTSHPEGASLLKKFFELFRKPNSAARMHPEAVPLLDRVHIDPFCSWKVIAAQFYYLARKPMRYFLALGALIRGNWGSANYLLGGLAIFPKTVCAARTMEAAGIDHIHAHFANHPAAAAFLIHRLTGIPYSFTAHGADLQVDQHMLRDKVREAAHVVTISKYNRQLILDVCGDEYGDKVSVIHCGVDTSVFQPADETEPEPSGAERMEIVCIGTMYEVKGHTYLIEACRLLQQRGVDFSCRLIGDGPDRDQLIQQVERAGLGERITFCGVRTRDEISKLLPTADVLAVPSVHTKCGRREGIPVVLMEAMASGAAVVASEISGIPELVEHGVSGLLVPPRNAAALADSLEQLASDVQLRRRLGRGGREKVLREFDLQTNALALMNLFCGVKQ